MTSTERMDSTAKIRIVIADDEPNFLEAISDLLSAEPSMEIVGEAKDSETAIRLAEETTPDICLLDVKMAGGGPITARQVSVLSPRTRIIALTAYDDLPTVVEMLKAGAIGYLVKGVSPSNIPKMIALAMEGQAILPRTVMTEVIREFVSSLEKAEGMSKQLQNLDQAKGEMAQILSHELRTPVSILQGSAITLALADQRGLPAEHRALLADSIQRASQRISRLITNVTVATNLRSDHSNSRPQLIGEILQRCLSEFPLEKERIRIAAEAQSLDASIWAADDLAVRSIVLVLENALIASPLSEPVEVDVTLQEAAALIHILDRGPGVPEEMREHIFDAFTQIDSSTTRSTPGIGIGLFLARRIVDLHGGRISLQAREGGGSDFTLEYPRFHPP